jgi:hypothetical protein
MLVFAWIMNKERLFIQTINDRRNRRDFSRLCACLVIGLAVVAWLLS